MSNRTCWFESSLGHNSLHQGKLVSEHGDLRYLGEFNADNLCVRAAGGKAGLSRLSSCGVPRDNPGRRSVMRSVLRSRKVRPASRCSQSRSAGVHTCISGFRTQRGCVGLTWQGGEHLALTARCKSSMARNKCFHTRPVVRDSTLNLPIHLRFTASIRSETPLRRFAKHFFNTLQSGAARQVQQGGNTHVGLSWESPPAVDAVPPA